MVKSHIQMPRQVMKNFTNENGQLYFYDFTDSGIHTGHPKTLYTEKGYFSDYVEWFLGAKVESNLGKLLKFIKETDFGMDGEPPIEYAEIAFDYVYSLIARSPSFMKQMKSNSIFYQFLSLVEQRSIAAHDGFLLAREKNTLGQYQVSFLTNKSTEELVLPTGGLTQYEYKIICPVTPRKAIILDDMHLTEEGENVVAVYEVEDQKTIHEINKLSFMQEMNRDKKYVISRSKILLQNISDEVSTMKKA